MDKVTLVLLSVVLAGTAAAVLGNIPLFDLLEIQLGSDRNTRTVASDEVDGESRDCTRKMGNGSCVDRSRNTFNFCSAPPNLHSLETCQSIAKNHSSISGIEYVTESDDAYCRLLLDASDIDAVDQTGPSCPESFSIHRNTEFSSSNSNNNRGGHGPVQGIYSVGECYSCHDGHCRTLVGSGGCVDENGNAFDYCLANDLSLNECQKIAANNNKHILGIEHGSYEETSYCFVLLDDILSGPDPGRWCPANFSTDEFSGSNGGTGFVHDAIAVNGYECFACIDIDHAEESSSTVVTTIQETVTSFLRQQA